MRVFRELLEGCFTDPTRGSNKDCNEIRGEGGGMREFEDWTEDRVTIVIPAGTKATVLLVLLVEDVSVY